MTSQSLRRKALRRAPLRLYIARFADQGPYLRIERLVYFAAPEGCNMIVQALKAARKTGYKDGTENLIDITAVMTVTDSRKNKEYSVILV